MEQFTPEQQSLLMLKKITLQLHLSDAQQKEMSAFISEKIAKDALSSFVKPLHRLEFVRNLDGATYINDSKSTNVDSVIYALKQMQGKGILLLGGRDKNILSPRV